MKTLLKSIIAGLVLTFVVTVVSAGEIIKSLPKQTKIVASLNIEKLTETPFFDQFKKLQKDKYDFMVNTMGMIFGFDLLDVTEFWLVGDHNDHGLFVLKGEFDPKFIEEKVSRGPNNEFIELDGCEFAMLCPDDKHENKKNLASVIDCNTIVIGNPEMVKVFIRNLNGTGKAETISENDTKIICKAFEGKEIFKGIMLTFPEKELTKSPFLKLLSPLTLTGNMNKDNNNTALKLTVATSSMQNAEGVTKILQGLRIFLSENPGKVIPNRNVEFILNYFLKDMSIEKQESNVIVNSNIDSSLIFKLMKNKRTAGN